MYTEESTILVPGNTQFITHVMLMDTNNIYELTSGYDNYPAYVFTALPIDDSSYSTVDTLIDQAIQTITYGAGPYSKKEARSGAYDKTGMMLFSQLFPPKVCGEDTEYYQLHQRKARIKGHLREDPTGKIFLQADYIDLEALPEDPFVCSASQFADLDDF